MILCARPAILTYKICYYENVELLTVYQLIFSQNLICENVHSLDYFVNFMMNVSNQVIKIPLKVNQVVKKTTSRKDGKQFLDLNEALV
ncbi:UNVERIFIED_CONTAM: hypothetical protein RMT77_019873 [Armadillidium vulgare]